MKKQLTSPVLGGTVRAIASKSAAHRLLICAALADRPTRLVCRETNADIDATVACLNALGANIEKQVQDGVCSFMVSPIPTAFARTETPICMDCGESGSTLRFLLPVAGALGKRASIVRRGRLAERPLSPLYEQLQQHGMSLSSQTDEPLQCTGQLTAGEYTLAANVSSQFITGLLFALSRLSAPSRLNLTGEVQSRPYIDLTLQALAQFGADITWDATGFDIRPACPLTSPETVTAEGDWSNAAFFLAAGAIGRHPVTVTGLDADSLQGDRAMVSLLERFGAKITTDEQGITVSPAPLHGCDIDAAQIPDLVPILAVTASVAEGQTVIHHAERLRTKESDRLRSVAAMLSALGADIQETQDGFIIHGRPTLSGGTVDACNDHRIAMSAAIAATVCTAPVVIDGAEAVGKSYPDFWNDFESLCI